MSPEDWKTYWRTCHLTAFEVQAMEEERWKQTFRDIFGSEPICTGTWSREEGHVDLVQNRIDAMELQLMGIRS